jgi:hypothetical protein
LPDTLSGMTHLRLLALSLIAACCLFAFSPIAKADTQEDNQLEVTLHLTSGQAPIVFTLTPEQGKNFWRRWRAMEKTTTIVPAPDEMSSYRGLTIRQDRTNFEVRLFNGIGSDNKQTSKIDTDRTLEITLLGAAPPPFGPIMARQISQAMPTAAPKDGALSANQMIIKCRKAHGTNWTARSSCLETALAKALPPAIYGSALENSIRALANQLPPDPLPASPLGPVGTSQSEFPPAPVQP